MYSEAHIFFSSAPAPGILAEIRQVPGLIARLKTLKTVRHRRSCADELHFVSALHDAPVHRHGKQGQSCQNSKLTLTFSRRSVWSTQWWIAAPSPRVRTGRCRRCTVRPRTRRHCTISSCGSRQTGWSPCWSPSRSAVHTKLAIRHRAVVSVAHCLRSNHCHRKCRPPMLSTMVWRNIKGFASCSRSARVRTGEPINSI